MDMTDGNGMTATLVRDGSSSTVPPSTAPPAAARALKSYYTGKLDELELTIRDKTQNLRRLEAQRNTLNGRVRLLREELSLLQEPGSYVGEVVKAMGKKKVLVKVGGEGKYIVDIDKDIDINACTPNTRVALRNDSYTLHRILPTKVDPLVSLMKVEKVPDATYDMVGGLEKQIQEIKEVIELPIKHPELFEALGVAQPKVRPCLCFRCALERGRAHTENACPGSGAWRGEQQPHPRANALTRCATMCAVVWTHAGRVDVRPSGYGKDAAGPCRGAPHRVRRWVCIMCVK